MKWLAVLVVLAASFCTASQASAETRSLKLYFIHTKERAEITFKRNGRYDQSGLNQINRFLRDWRRNEPAKMDPRLLDLVWEVYRAVGARDYIHVVSAYRSPATNSMLRSRSSGVAKNSQHTLGKAMDFFIPGVPLSKLRAAGFKAEGGGVGYYPKSGSPFVHLDVGNVRSWPRMNRNELMALFPDGRTIHVPTDGKPLPGYKQAMAAYESRKRSGGSVQIAGLGSGSSNSAARSGSRGLLASLFGGGRDQEEDDAESAATVASAPARPAARQAPQPQPAQPEAAPAAPQTPESIIAALPSRAVPLPIAAPRPMADVGAPAAAPLIAGLPAAPVRTEEAAAEPPVAATQVALNVPVPMRRPDYAPPPAVEQAQQVASADAVAPEVDLPVSAIVPERQPHRGGSDAILEMLASSAAEARADVVINNPPVPGLRPRLRAEDVRGGEAREKATRLAAASPAQSAGNVFVLASLPNSGLAGNQARVPVVGGVDRVSAASMSAVPSSRPAAGSPPATPRVAMISRQAGSAPAAALESGVRTTAKGAKPRAAQARPDPRPVAKPVQQELTRWVFRRDMTVTTAGGSTEPSIAHDIVRSAPRAVYTTGFQQADVSAVANRFTGKAVTFIPMARFATN